MDFLKRINKNLFRKCIEFSCIEVVGLPDDNYLFNYIGVKNKNNKLEIVKKKKGISEFNELRKYLKKDIPIVIAITGRGVITKKLDVALLQDEPDYLKYILPNAEADDFIIQTQSNDFGSIYCAIARRNDVASIINLFSLIDLFVVGLSIGILCISSIISLTEISQNKIILTDYKIQIKNNQIVDISPNKYRKQENDYKIGNEEIDQALIIAFSAGIQYFILNQKNHSSEIAMLKEKEYKYFKRFKTTILIFLLCCFVGLFLNFLVFNHFNTLSSELINELASYDKLLTKHTYLKTELEIKNKIVVSLGLEQDLGFSFIVDQLASTVTVPITLTELNFYPLRSTRSKNLEFIRDKLLIKGVTQSANDLNSWIKSVRNFYWVKNLTITDFLYSDKDKKAKFEIELMLMDKLNEQ